MEEINNLFFNSVEFHEIKMTKAPYDRCLIMIWYRYMDMKCDRELLDKKYNKKFPKYFLINGELLYIIYIVKVP